MLARSLKSRGLFGRLGLVRFVLFGGLRGRGDLALQVHLSWAPDQREAEALAWDQWRSNVLGPPVAWDTDTVEAFDVIGEHITPEQVCEAVLVSSDLGQHAAWLHEFVDLGWDERYLHFVGKRQEAFIDAFGGSVLPRLAPTETEVRR